MGSTERRAALLVGMTAAAWAMAADSIAAACSGPAPRSEGLVWIGGDVIALLAPSAQVVRVSSAESTELGAVPWAREHHASLAANGQTIFSLELTYAGGSSDCTPTRVALFRGWLGQRARRVSQIEGGAFVGRVLPSPQGTRVAVQLDPALDEQPRFYAIVAVGTRTRELLRIEAEDFAWMGDDVALVVRSGARRAALVHVSGTTAETVSEYEAPEGAQLTRVDDAMGPVLYQSGSTPELVQPSLAEETSNVWSHRGTRLRVPPTALSVASGLALYVDAARSRGVLRAIDTAQIMARVHGPRFYSRAAFDASGQRLALLSHERIPLEDDGDSPLDGAPALEVIDLQSGTIRAWGAQGSSYVVTAPREPSHSAGSMR